MNWVIGRASESFVVRNTFTARFAEFLCKFHLISAPYYREPTESGESSYPMNCYWVSPPPESRPLEVARPMNMQHNVVVDPSIEEDVTSNIVSG